MSSVDRGTHYDADTGADANPYRDRPAAHENTDHQSDAPAEDDAETRT